MRITIPPRRSQSRFAGFRQMVIDSLSRRLPGPTLVSIATVDPRVSPFPEGRIRGMSYVPKSFPFRRLTALFASGLHPPCPLLNQVQHRPSGKEGTWDQRLEPLPDTSIESSRSNAGQEGTRLYAAGNFFLSDKNEGTATRHVMVKNPTGPLAQDPPHTRLSLAPHCPGRSVPALRKTEEQ